MTPADRAWQLLVDGLTPQQIVAQLTPTTKAEAIHLARRLPLLDERPDADRGAAIARLATRFGMKRFGLAFTPEGRVGDNRTLHRHNTPRTTRTISGDGCTVEYVAGYFRDRDHFQFTGLGGQVIPFTGSHHWSHFADPDAVLALGGPEAYLAALTSVGRDGAKAFEEAFTGKLPEVGRKPRKPVVGEHTAKVVAPVSRPPVFEPPQQEPQRGGQRDLFGQAEEPGHGR